jgi:cell division septation protein DedD
MNDKTKHRIVGVVVVAAFLVILIPALMKDESSETKQSETQYATIERPVTPMVEPVSSSSVEVENESYQSNQVAHVSLDQPAANQQPLVSSNEAAAEQNATPSHDSMESMESIESSTAAQQSRTTTPSVVTPVAPPQPPKAQPQPKPVAPPPAPVKPKPVPQKTVVVVPKPKPVVKATAKLTNVCFQLGTFSNPNNASVLVTRLKEKGFTAAKTTTIILPTGRKIVRVSYCKPMTKSEIASMRSRLALLVGTSPMITR